MTIIGITGGIGAGKSYVSDLLRKRYGIPVYDCDTEAKRLNVESKTIRQQLIALVGPDVYAPDGSLQRQILANYLFANSENAQRINAITHPVVAEDFRAWAGKQAQEGRTIVGMECAILFESGFDRLVDISINVDAPRQLCIERATSRDKASEQAIIRRIDLQMGSDERQRRADYTLVNDGRDLLPQIDCIINLIN